MSGKSFPVILFIGDEFRVREKIDEFSAALLKSAKEEIPRQIYYLSEKPLDDILVDARTLPFLCSSQIFILRDLGKLKKKDLASFESYLENPFQSTTLILEGTDLAKTDEWVSLCRKKAKVEDLSGESRDTSDLKMFIQRKVKQSEKMITQEAVSALIEKSGAMPVFLDSMVERLIGYAGDKKEITGEMAAVFEENWQQNDVFQLTNAIASRQTARALALFHEALEQSEKDIVGIFGILHWQLRRLWLASMLSEQGASESEIAKKCKASEKQLPYLLKPARQFGRKKLERALEGLFQLDWKLKTGRADGAGAVESWLVEMTS